MLHALVLGLVQGLGEFLPISSSAHLILVPWLFKWQDPGLGFDVALHMGTLVAVVIYFYNDIWLLIKGFWHSLFKSTRDLQSNIYQKLAWLIILASIPGAIIGALLDKAAETTLRNPLLVACDLAIFGVLLWFLDKMVTEEKNLDKITPGRALAIGFSQAIAIFPGVSRSGATMLTARAFKFTRADAARFSFLMSMPIIFGSGILKFNELNQGVTHAELAVGFLAAAISGFVAIKFLLRYLSTHSFGIFAAYRIILAAIILAIYMSRLGH
jgi:undecaprenyl-diphosphatase